VERPSHLDPQRTLVSIFGLAAFLLWGFQEAASAPRSSSGDDKASIQIQIEDARGALVAGPKSHSSSSKTGSATLDVNREYQPGDRIIFGGPKRMAVQTDQNMPECLIYAPLAASNTLSYVIPYGREERQTGSAYAPESFAGNSHVVTIRALSHEKLSEYRDLALNPCDLVQPENSSIPFFPHASSNSVSRSLFDFEARNAIDGRVQNGHHGVWPYQSWGPQLRTDIWWKVDFGRSVELDKVRLMIRADFPHDSYWKSAKVEFSDGSQIAIQITSSPEFQDFPFSKRTVSWLRITDVVPEDPTKWCSLIEVEAWGRDLP
jgi:hypothetical protein